MLADFAWLRPWAMWLAPLGLLLYLLVTYAQRRLRSDELSSWIDAELLPHLSIDSAAERSSGRWFAASLALLWLLACVIIAGPSSRSLDVPLKQDQQPLLILLDLSWSMNATDLSPDRISRARFKIEDLLNSRKEGLTGLIVYSGSAHLAVPLSSDKETILNLLQDLRPGIMPINGSKLELALELAAQTLGNSGYLDSGHYLIFTDGVDLDSARASVDLISELPARGSVIALGNPNSSEGAPIRSGDGFVRDQQGELVLARPDWQGLNYLSANTALQVYPLSLDSSRDVEAALGDVAAAANDLQRELNIREDQGYWLLPALLLLWLLLSANGGRSLLLILLLVTAIPQAYAEAWQNRDQQALQLLRSEQYQQAAELFSEPQWRAYAHTRAGEYQQALDLLADSEEPGALYNRGNTHLRSLQLEQAVADYQRLLQQTELPEQLRADAEHNLAIAEQLLEQSQQQQQAGDESNEGDAGDGQQQAGEDSGEGDGAQQSGSEQQPSSGQQDSGGQQQGQGQDSSSSDSAESNSQTAGSEQQQQQQPGQSQSDSESGKSDTGFADQQGEEAGDEANQQAQSSELDESGELEDSDQELRAQQRQLAEQLALESPASEGQGDAELSPEQRARVQAQRQLQRQLQAIPDDPGGLLRRKFELQARRLPRQRYDGIEEQL